MRFPGNWRAAGSVKKRVGQIKEIFISFLLPFCNHLYIMGIPSIDMGKYACQRAFSALFALFGLAGVSLAPRERRSAASARICRLSPPASQKAKITRKSIADRCTAVCPEQKCVQTRKGLQVILAVLPKGLTRYGRISARQNRVCPCQSMVSAENGHKMLHFGEQEQRYDPFDRRRKGV